MTLKSVSTQTHLGSHPFTASEDLVFRVAGLQDPFKASVQTTIFDQDFSKRLFVFNPTDQSCQICTDSLSSKKDLVLHHPVNSHNTHAFHKDCLDQWLTEGRQTGSNPTCPNSCPIENMVLAKDLNEFDQLVEKAVHQKTFDLWESLLAENPNIHMESSFQAMIQKVKKDFHVPENPLIEKMQKEQPNSNPKNDLATITVTQLNRWKTPDSLIELRTWLDGPMKETVMKNLSNLVQIVFNKEGKEIIKRLKEGKQLQEAINDCAEGIQEIQRENLLNLIKDLLTEKEKKSQNRNRKSKEAHPTEIRRKVLKRAP